MRLTLKLRGHRIATFNPFICYLCVVSAFLILPRLQLQTPYVVVACSSLITLLVLFIRRTPWDAFGLYLVGLSSIFLILHPVTPVDGINEMIRSIRFFLPVLWACYALRYCDKNHIKVFVVFFIVMIAFICSRTLEALREFPSIARILAQGKSDGSAELNLFRIHNVGGFGFSYMMGVVTISSVGMAIESERVCDRVIWIGAATLSFYFILQTLYTTLLLLTIAGSCYAAVLKVKNKRIKFAIIFLSIFGLFLIPSLLGIIAAILPNDSALPVRLLSLQQALLQGNMALIGSRPARLAQGIKVWLSRPFFGNPKGSIGSHSFVVGTLAQYGIVGMSIFIFMTIFSRKIIMKSLNSSKLPTIPFRASLFYILLLTIMNPIGYLYEITISLFTVTPLLGVMLRPRKNLNDAGFGGK